MDLFQVVPENFFSLLASKNKHIYFGCIVEAFRIYEEGSILGIDKKIVVEVLTDYLDQIDSKLDSSEFVEEEVNTSREKANYILRKMEEHGWIDIDVTNDYQEILNFRDYAITVIEALQDVAPMGYDVEAEEQAEYKGYIYTIYSLLMNDNYIDYGMLMEQVYRNTKFFIRELRKLDSRLKEYLRGIMDTSEIKDLLEQLVSYKTNLMDKAYYRLKTSDNINKYRSAIIKKLEQFQRDDQIMEIIVNTYRQRYADLDDATRRAFRDMTEIVDTFYGLDDIIKEIDIKNKTYVNSTIGKIQFLLNDDDNIPGKLTTILKYVSKQHKEGKLEEALQKTAKIYNIHSVRRLSQESLYTPRGSYKHNDPQKLDLTEKDLFDIQNNFLKEYETNYSEKKVHEFIRENIVDGALYVSNIVHYDSELDDILMAFYALIYASNDDNANYSIKKLDRKIEHQRFLMYDFVITKEN